MNEIRKAFEKSYKNLCLAFVTTGGGGNGRYADKNTAALFTAFKKGQQFGTCQPWVKQS